MSYKPKQNEIYYYIDEGGATNVSVWSRNGSIDTKRLEFGNCFKTAEEVVRTAKWLRVLKVLKEDTKGFDPDWEDEKQQKWYVMYNFRFATYGSDDMGLYAAYTKSVKSSIIYFATKKDAKDSIKKHKKEWLTFFNVEED